MIDPGTYDFVPDSPLPKGKTIAVRIKGGPDGVRSAVNGSTMQQDHIARFRTYPPVTISVVQVCDGQTAHFLAGKASLVRVSMGPFHTGQVDTVVMASLDIDGTLVLPAAAHTVKTTYNVLERKEGVNTVNLFIPRGTAFDTSGEHMLHITLVPQDPAARARAGDDVEHYHAVILNEATKPYRVEFVACNEGAWESPMSPAELQDYYRVALAHSDFIKAIFPVTETTYQPKIEGTEVKVNSWSPLVNYVGIFKWKYYMIHLDRRAKANPNIDRVVGIFPAGELGGKSGLSRGKNVDGVLIDAFDNTYMAAAHELMHGYGEYLEPHEEYQDNPPYGRLADSGWWVAKGQAGCITNYNPHLGSYYDILDRIYRRNRVRVRPLHSFSFMGETTPLAWWIRRNDYAFLYREMVGPIGVLRKVTEEGEQDGAAGHTVLNGDTTLALISGQVWSNGTVTVNPIIQSADLSEETPEDYTSGYAAQFWVSGSLARTYYFSPITFPDDPEITEAFSFVASVPVGTSRVVIRNWFGTVLADIEGSQYAPLPQIMWPNGGETISGVVTATWDSIDFDLDDMTYTLYYSPDEGAEWSLVAMDLTNMWYVWDTSLYPGSTNALMKVLASDGMNTAEDISDAIFEVTSKPPTVFIVDPPDDVFVGEDGIKLRALVYDPEGGNVNDDAIHWISDRDGTLGTGSALAIGQLSYGAHDLFCEAVGASGMTGTSEVVSIDVRPLVTDCEPGQRGLQLTWFGRSGHAYYVLETETLSPPAWHVSSNLMDIGGATIPAEVDGLGADVSVVLSNAAENASSFYRIGADNPESPR